MKTLFVLVIVFILGVAEAVAQTVPPPTAPPPATSHQGHAHGTPQTAPVKPTELTPVEPTQIPIGARVGGAPTTPSNYDGAGRRDPFMSLIYARRSSTPSGTVAARGGGLPSMSITDVRIAGILRMGEHYIAILEGPDKQSYNARPKDRLADAVIKSIDATGVVFTEQSEMGGLGREIRKVLRRAAEDNR